MGVIAPAVAAVEEEAIMFEGEHVLRPAALLRPQGGMEATPGPCRDRAATTRNRVQKPTRQTKESDRARAVALKKAGACGYAGDGAPLYHAP